MTKKRFLLALIRYIVLISLFIASFFLLRFFYAKVSIKTYEAPLEPVKTVMAERGSIEHTLKVNGYVESKDEIAVVPYVDGTIIEYYVSEGDYVKEGDLIALIDREPYELQLRQAEAAVSGYVTSFEKVSALYEKNAISRQEYDTLKAQCDAAKAQEELARLQLSYTEVRAKSDGTVLKTLASKGAAASKGTPIAMIADLSELVVNVNIGEKYYITLRDNIDTLKISVTKPAYSVDDEIEEEASVAFISPYVDPSTKNFSIQLDINNDNSALRPGMYVKCSITYDSVEGYLLPRKVLKLDKSAYYVDEDSKAVYLDFSDAEMDDEYFIIPEELKDKNFIIEGQSDILSGESVRIVE